MESTMQDTAHSNGRARPQPAPGATLANVYTPADGSVGPIDQSCPPYPEGCGAPAGIPCRDRRSHSSPALRPHANRRIWRDDQPATCDLTDDEAVSIYRRGYAALEAPASRPARQVAGLRAVLDAAEERIAARTLRRQP